MKKIVCFYLLVLIASFSKASAQIITTVAGNGINGYSGDGGAATVAEISMPVGVTTDISGNIYIGDYINNVIRKVNTSGIITTIAGNGAQGYAGDGGAATDAQLYGPEGLVFDASGNLYFVDTHNDVIRRINTAGIITTVAGNGTLGYMGDGSAATAARLLYPSFITIDGSGNLYIADEGNNVIRKVNTSGIITTIAGSYAMGYGYSGDGGPATVAQMHYPLGVTVDASGNLYIADALNSVIRKVNTLGIITTVAGSGIPGYSGDEIPATTAQLDDPAFVTIDPSGNLYIADAYYGRIRKVNASGIITTVAGNGTTGYSGDGGAATNAQLDDPAGITIDVSGNLYIADSRNNRVRKVNIGTTDIQQIGTLNNDISVYPNPASNALFVSVPEAKGAIELQDISGRTVAEKNVMNTITAFDICTIPRGIYLVVWNDGNGGKPVQKIVVE